MYACNTNTYYQQKTQYFKHQLQSNASIGKNKKKINVFMINKKEKIIKCC